MNSRKRKALRGLGKVLFVLYIGFLIYFLIFSDLVWQNGLRCRNTIIISFLFKEIKRFWQYRHQLGFFAMFTNLFGNVIIFIPFGFFLPMASKYRSCFATLFWSFGLSLCVETFQLLTKVGSFDVDDILLNTIGGVAGHIIFVICVAIRRRHVRKR